MDNLLRRVFKVVHLEKRREGNRRQDVSTCSLLACSDEDKKFMGEERVCNASSVRLVWHPTSIARVRRKSMLELTRCGGTDNTTP